jgi:hypothetical protein
MWNTFAIAGVTAVIIGGAGTAAVAVSGTTAPTPSPSLSGTVSAGTVSGGTVSGGTVSGGTAAGRTASRGTTAGSPVSTGAASDSPAADSSANASRTKAGKHEGIDRLRRAVHATWVSENKKTKTFTTHDTIRGQVTAVSATSITVKSADNVTETYVLNSATKVHTRAKKAAASISDVKAGDRVRVAGTGTTTLTASQVVDTKK